MNVRLGHNLLCYLLLLAGLLIPGAAAAPAEPDPEQGAAARLNEATSGDGAHVAAQLANVERLLEKSSGAQRVLASDNALAKKIRLYALERHRKAETAHRSGDYAAAGQLLQEAVKSMFQAVRVLGPATEAVDKKIEDFERRADSTRVLLVALKRIAAEEGEQGAASKTAAAVEKNVAEARKLLKAGQYGEARSLLDGAYEMTKVAVEGLRDGKSLVRTLTFESEEAEYRYELDRNDTHHMLLNVLLKEKEQSAQAGAIVMKFVQHADELREQARQKADSGDFRDAIRLLDLSTKDLVRAIRGAGLYITG